MQRLQGVAVAWTLHIHTHIHPTPIPHPVPGTEKSGVGAGGSAPGTATYHGPRVTEAGRPHWLGATSSPACMETLHAWPRQPEGTRGHSNRETHLLL